MPSRLIELSSAGLYCPLGGFHVDPWTPVERAIITHAHADHARFGSARYLCAAPGEQVLRARLNGTGEAVIETLPYGESLPIGEVQVSLYPAGHVLGSAQVCVEHRGARCVVSGDYATRPNPTCDAFTAMRCETFISECTFALPVFRWPDHKVVFAEINEWWARNRTEGRHSILYAYALGKAQHVLAGIDAGIGPVLVHGALLRLIDAYRAAGVILPKVQHATDETIRSSEGRALLIAPPSAAASPWRRRFGDASSGFVSGWMKVRGMRRRRSVDRGFVLSDHADWDGLNGAIEATGAGVLGLTHGYTEAMARWQAMCGRRTEVYPTRFDAGPEGEEE